MRIEKTSKGRKANWMCKQGQRTPCSSGSQAGDQPEKDLTPDSQAVEGFAVEYTHINKTQNSCVAWTVTPNQSQKAEEACRYGMTLCKQRVC